MKAFSSSATLIDSLRKATRGIFILSLLVLVGYVILITCLHMHLAGKAVSISQAVGLPADVERGLYGILPWLLVATTVPYLISVTFHALNPIGNKSKSFRQVGMIFLTSIALLLLPHVLRTIRGVDASGLPNQMKKSDPHLSQWFSPDGQATLFYSEEEDGSMHFWTRPGITPDSGLTSKAVTPDIRKKWFNLQKELKQKSEETERLQHESKRIQSEQKAQEEAILSARQHEATIAAEQRRSEEARREQVRLAVEKVAKESESEKLRLRMIQLESELNKSREAAESAKPQKQNSSINVAQAPAAQLQQQAEKFQLLPGRVLTIRNRATTLEISADHYIEIERPGRPIATHYAFDLHRFTNDAGILHIHCRSPYIQTVTIRAIP